MSLETPTIEEESKIKHVEIAELVEPMLKIFQEIMPHLEKGEYDLIIGIDASGRIPTLIMDKLVNYVYTRNDSGQYVTKFLAGSGNEEYARERINEWNPQKRVLIVEDTVVAGSSIRFLTNILREKNIPFDIATVANFGSLDSGNFKERLGADNFYFGPRRSTSIYGSHHLGGVTKERGKALSEPLKKQYRSKASRSHSQNEINTSRSDVDLVVQSLIDWYESQTNNEDE